MFPFVRPSDCRTNILFRFVFFFFYIRPVLVDVHAGDSDVAPLLEDVGDLLKLGRELLTKGTPRLTEIHQPDGHVLGEEHMILIPTVVIWIGVQ